MTFEQYIKEACALADLRCSDLDLYEKRILKVLWEHCTPVADAVAATFDSMPDMAEQE